MQAMKKIICCLLIGAFLCSVAQTPSVKDIERQKQSKQKEITETSKKLDQNKSNTRRSLRALDRIAADIKGYHEQIVSLNKQIADINLKISVVNREIARNDSLLAKLRDNYLTAIKKMRSHRNSGNRLMFIFSSESFHQAYRRMRYLKEFSRWREHQTEEIRKIIARLEEEKHQLEMLNEEKRKAVDTINSTKLSLEKKRMEQARVVASLKEEGAELQQVLAQGQVCGVQLFYLLLPEC